MAQEKLISLNNLSTFKDNVDVLLNNKDAYGVCSTAANVAAKTVSHSSFVLTNGVSISVKFENSNTAENPTLNVNGTGAKALYRFGTSKVGTTEDTSWSAGSIVTLVYDGTNWLMSDVQASANNTTYDLGVGTGSDSNKIVLTGSDGSANKVTVPYATSAGDAATVNGKTVATNVPADAVFTDTTYTFSSGTNNFVVTSSNGNASTVTVTPSIANATTASSGLMSNTDKIKIDGIASGAEINQNAFSNIKVGSSTIQADSKTDTFELVQGSNVTITPDITNDKITIAANDTTYSNATTTTAGLMSTSDKSKLDGIASGAEVNQNAFSSIDVTQGSVTTNIAADSKTDKLTLVGGTNVTLTPDATNDKITISATDTTYSANNGVALSGTTFYNSGVRAIAQGSTNGTINVNTNGSTADVAVKGLGSMAYKSSVSKSDVGLGNVANLDQSKAIASITRSGTTFTATAIDGTTSSFTQQDNNTTYTGANGISLSGTTFSNSGVRSIATGGSNGTINVNTNGSTANVAVKGLGNAAYTNVTDTYSSTGTAPVSGKAVAAAIAAMPEPMIFKGSLGTGGTITTLPTAAADNEGFTYKVITAGTYASQAAKVGDTFISDGSSWVLIPSGDEPSGTVTSVGITAGTGISVSGSPITSSGSITVTNSGVRAVATGTTNGTININTNGTTANVAVTGLKALAYKDSLAKGDVGLGNVANLDQSKAIKSITRSGTTFTATAIDGTTSSFTQQDNNTTYTGANGVSLSGTTFSNSGVRGVASGTANGTINVNTNGSTADVAVKGLGSAAYTASTAYATSGHNHDSTYLKLAGGTLTGATEFNNGKMPLAAGKITGLTAGASRVYGDGIAISNPTTSNDVGFIRVTGTGESDTVLEICTGDDGGGSTAETIAVRQYNTSNAIAKEAKLLDPSGNTSFPGTVTAASFSGSIANATGLTKSQVTTALGYTPPTTDTNTTYSAGSNITLTGTVFSLTKANVTGALGYTPPTTNTTYSNVSSASAGLAPKGAAVSSQSQSTKFLREDGSWAAPSYTTNTNTTYTFANGTNGFTVTPSGGTAQTVTVTPSITNNVTGSGTNGYIAKWNGANTVTNGPAFGSATTTYLRNDGSWATPANTTYANVSTSAAGLAPKVTDTSKYLKGDGTWATPTNTTYSNATTATAGLMSKDDKVKLNGIATGATANTGTVTSITLNATSPIAIDSASAITTSGTRTLSHANSGATAGSYGDSAAQTPAYGGTFKVPYVTVNATGHVTAISEHTVKIPASDNTNTTYTFAAGTNSFKVTPSGGSAQTVTITPNDSTKLPLAGGTMTGQIKLASTGFRTNSNDGYSIDQYGNFQAMGSANTFNMSNTSGVGQVQVKWSNGDIKTNGSMTVGGIENGGCTLKYNSTDQCLDFVF